MVVGLLANAHAQNAPVTSSPPAPFGLAFLAVDEPKGAAARGE